MIRGLGMGFLFSARCVLRSGGLAVSVLFRNRSRGHLGRVAKIGVGRVKVAQGLSILVNDMRRRRGMERAWDPTDAVRRSSGRPLRESRRVTVGGATVGKVRTRGPRDLADVLTGVTQGGRGSAA